MKYSQVLEFIGISILMSLTCSCSFNYNKDGTESICIYYDNLSTNLVLMRPGKNKDNGIIRIHDNEQLSLWDVGILAQGKSIILNYNSNRIIIDKPAAYQMILEPDEGSCFFAEFALHESWEVPVYR